MTTKEYELLNNSDNELLLRVEIQTTPGTLATTSVYTILNYEKKNRQKLNDSTDVNCFYKIGISKEWDGSLLVIKILLDLNSIDESQYQNVFDTTKIYYHLSGGKNDEKFEHLKSDIIVKTKNGKKIVFEKRFFLTY